jgi:hypothetical protein
MSKECGKSQKNERMEAKERALERQAIRAEEQWAGY